MQNVPSRSGAAVVGWGSLRPDGQSEYSDQFVEVKDDGEVLGVEVGHHEEKDQERCSIRAT